VSWIYGKDHDGPRAAFLRYQPGASVPTHEHLGYEHIFVLAGAQSDGTTRYPAGTFSVFPPGWHHAIESPEGCLALAIWTGPLAFRD
jgi:anti-sigma factor ChrR (cupin superfamily)